MKADGFVRGAATAQAAAAGLSAGLKTASTSFIAAGTAVTGAGRALTTGITLPLVAVAAASIKAASDFESSFAGVRKTVDATEAEFAKLAQGFRDMAKEIPISVHELNRIGESAGQLGIAKEHILDFTRTVATTNLSAEEAANAFARIANIMGTTADNYSRLGSTVVALGNNLATTESEIVEFGLRIAGAGRIAGLTEPQVLAIGGAFASVGIQAEAGGTAVQKVLLAITKEVVTSGDKLEGFAKVAGMSAQQFAAAWREDAGAAFVAFVEGLGKSGDNAIQILDDLGLKNERTRRAFLSMANAGDLLRNAMDLANTSWRENNALTEEAEKRFATFASQLALAKGQLYDVAITLGFALLPFVRQFLSMLQAEFIPALERLVTKFQELPEAQQQSILKWLAMAAAIGPVLIVVGSLITAIGRILGLFALLAAHPVAAALLAIGAAFVVAYTQSERFREIVNNTLVGLGVMAATAASGVIAALQGIADYFLSWADNILRAQALAFGWIPGLGAKLKEASNAFSQYRDEVNAGFDKDQAAILGWRDRIIDASRDAANGIQSIHPPLAELRAEFERMKAEKVALEISLDDQASNPIAVIGTALDGLGAKNTSPTITAIDNASGTVEVVYGGLNKLGATHPNSNVSISDLATGPIANVQGGLDRVKSTHPNSTLSITDSASGPISGVQGRLNTVAGTHPRPTVTLIDNASAAALRIVGILNSIPRNVTSTVTVNTIRNDTGPISGRHFGGPIFHDGGMVGTYHSGGLKGDEVLAKLQRGEWVMQRSAVKDWGLDFMAAVNRGKPRGGDGPSVGLPRVNPGSVDLTIVNVTNVDGKEVERTVRKETVRFGRANVTAFGRYGGTRG